MTGPAAQGLLERAVTGRASRMMSATPVGELAGIDESRQLPAYVRCVFSVLAEAVSQGELRQVMNQLPEDFQNLVPAEPDRADPDAFLARVQEYGQLAGRGEAERTAGATLNLLADRISVGQAGDLSPALPEGLRTYLRTNKKTPQSFDKETYLDRVATAVGVTDHAIAEQRVRAVLRTLREWESDREIENTLAELPPEIAELFKLSISRGRFRGRPRILPLRGCVQLSSVQYSTVQTAPSGVSVGVTWWLWSITWATRLAAGLPPRTLREAWTGRRGGARRRGRETDGDRTDRDREGTHAGSAARGFVQPLRRRPLTWLCRQP